MEKPEKTNIFAMFVLFGAIKAETSWKPQNILRYHYFRKSHFKPCIMKSQILLISFFAVVLIMSVSEVSAKCPGSIEPGHPVDGCTSDKDCKKMNRGTQCCTFCKGSNCNSYC